MVAAVWVSCMHLQLLAAFEQPLTGMLLKNKEATEKGSYAKKQQNKTIKAPHKSHACTCRTQPD
jgi:hypothetical protein